MRNMSFALTTPQFLEGSKTVTRRLGWGELKPGDLVMGCQKCMGFRAGESIRRLRIIVIISNQPEKLDRMATDCEYGDSEARKEGFPHMTGAEFVEMFAANMACQRSRIINRIEFRYLPGGRI